jgi:hypothetical protein
MYAAALAALIAVVSASTASARERRACSDPCLPPPPVAQALCVQPPCGGCPAVVQVCVPACCVEQPTVSWRQGAFGRQIGTYEWPCCGHRVKVVVDRRGAMTVR